MNKQQSEYQPLEKAFDYWDFCNKASLRTCPFCETRFALNVGVIRMDGSDDEIVGWKCQHCDVFFSLYDDIVAYQGEVTRLSKLLVTTQKGGEHHVL